MYKFKEIITKSLIDFEEIKYILANENIDLVNSYVVKESIFVKNDISILNSNYETILKNSLRLIDVNQDLFLSHVKYEEGFKKVSNITVLNREECKDFLYQNDYKDGFVIEKDIYVFSNNKEKINIINLINIGWFISVSKIDSTNEELISILDDFHIPYDEDNLGVSLDKLVINKIRRQAK